MKITTDTVHRTAVIMLETQAEINFIKQLMGPTSRGDEEAFGIGQDLYPEWKKLSRMADDNTPCFTVELER